jgi:acylphosphatase
MMEIEAIVSGKVQGVRYRAFVDEAAIELKLVGSVRNDRDGKVIVIAQGEMDVLKEFVEYLNEGSLLSKVEGVEVTWRSPSVTYSDFSVLH